MTRLQYLKAGRMILLLLRPQYRVLLCLNWSGNWKYHHHRHYHLSKRKGNQNGHRHHQKSSKAAQQEISGLVYCPRNMSGLTPMLTEDLAYLLSLFGWYFESDIASPISIVIQLPTLFKFLTNNSHIELRSEPPHCLDVALSTYTLTDT